MCVILRKGKKETVMEKTLFIIDGNSILYREFYALPGLTNKHGEFSGALFGFSKFIVELITKYKPSHMVVAFDAGKITFRNEIYDGYKATRKPMPVELKSQVEPVKNMLNAMNIKVVEQVGIEGDDVIGTIAKKFDCKKVIVTGDRDSYQLVDNNTIVYLNKKGLSNIKIIDENAILEEFKLTPGQMVFVKALQGDTSDNIPGVRGVGEKTALSLIQKYKNLDGVYFNINEIKGTLKDRLIEDKNIAYMSLDLAKINCNAELDLNLDEMQVKFPFTNEVKEIFSYNDFKSLVKKDEIFENICNEQKKFVVNREVCEILSIEQLLAEISNAKEIGFYKLNNAYHISDGKVEYVFNDLEMFNNSVEFQLKQVMENPTIRKVFFDSKAERHRFLNNGVDIRGDVFDCMIAKHLVLGESVTKIEDIIDEDESDFVASSLVSMSGELMSDLERMDMKSLYYDVEIPLSLVLFEMEKEGFKVDINRLKELENKYDNELSSLTKEIYAVVGREFNINSPKQLSEIIYDELMLSKSKKKSTASEVLEQIADRHPLIPLVIRYRKVAKFSSGFIKNMYAHLDNNNLVHTKFNQTLTTTGRLSSSEPNLQNIPIRGDESREIRSMFVAKDKNRVLVDMDYSQIELRILAHVANDDLLINAFNNGQDIHTQTAMDIFDVPALLVTPDMRRQAKVVNFGVVYGISEFGLATDLKISVYEAKKYIENFFNAHPKIKQFMNQSVEMAKSTGRATTILGRTRKMNDINSSNYQIRTRAERATYNMPIQGTASDIVKLAMIKVFNMLKNENLDAKLIMQVHDELIVDCDNKDKERVLKIMKEAMSGAMKLSVDLEVDGSVAYRWSDGH